MRLIVGRQAGELDADFAVVVAEIREWLVLLSCQLRDIKPT
ncbi:hypothetical protein [Alishewanella longhuensis]